MRELALAALVALAPALSLAQGGPRRGPPPDRVYDLATVTTVRGSMVTPEGAPALVVRSVARGDDTLVLRDEAGRPRWTGPRGGR